MASQRGEPSFPSFSDFVEGMPEYRQLLRVTSVATCKIAATAGVAPSSDDLFVRELYYTSTKKTGHFKIAAFTAPGVAGDSGTTPFVMCLFPRNHHVTKHIWVFDPAPSAAIGLTTASLMLFNSVRGAQVHLKRVMIAHCRASDTVSPSCFSVVLIRRHRNDHDDGEHKDGGIDDSASTATDRQSHASGTAASTASHGSSRVGGAAAGTPPDVVVSPEDGDGPAVASLVRSSLTAADAHHGGQDHGLSTVVAPPSHARPSSAARDSASRGGSGDDAARQPQATHDLDAAHFPAGTAPRWQGDVTSSRGSNDDTGSGGVVTHLHFSVTASVHGAPVAAPDSSAVASSGNRVGSSAGALERGGSAVVGGLGPAPVKGVRKSGEVPDPVVPSLQGRLPSAAAPSTGPSVGTPGPTITVVSARSSASSVNPSTVAQSAAGPSPVLETTGPSRADVRASQEWKQVRTTVVCVRVCMCVYVCGR